MADQPQPELQEVDQEERCYKKIVIMNAADNSGNQNSPMDKEDMAHTDSHMQPSFETTDETKGSKNNQNHMGITRREFPFSSSTFGTPISSATNCTVEIRTPVKG